MKKNKFVIVAICVVLLCGCVITAYALAEAPLFTTKPVLTESQAQQLKELERKGSEMVGSFIYQEKVIRCEADTTLQRMNIQEVRDLIAQCDHFEDVMSSLRNRQPYPDFVGGSGVTLIEYWIDATGNEKIAIIVEQSQVYYENANGAELLFDDNAPNYCLDNKKRIVINLFMVIPFSTVQLMQLVFAILY